MRSEANGSAASAGRWWQQQGFTSEGREGEGEGWGGWGRWGGLRRKNLGGRSGGRRVEGEDGKEWKI